MGELFIGPLSDRYGRKAPCSLDWWCSWCSPSATRPADRAGASVRNLPANVFGMLAVLFHLGLIDQLPDRGNDRSGGREQQWRQITDQAPLLAATIHDYFDQTAVRMRPNSPASIEKSLRLFTGYLTEHHPMLRCAADVRRDHVRPCPRAAGHQSDSPTNRDTLSNLPNMRMQVRIRCLHALHFESANRTKRESGQRPFCTSRSSR